MEILLIMFWQKYINKFIFIKSRLLFLLCLRFAWVWVMMGMQCRKNTLFYISILINYTFPWLFIINICGNMCVFLVWIYIRLVLGSGLKRGVEKRFRLLTVRVFGIYTILSFYWLPNPGFALKDGFLLDSEELSPFWTKDMQEMSINRFVRVGFLPGCC